MLMCDTCLCVNDCSICRRKWCDGGENDEYNAHNAFKGTYSHLKRKRDDAGGIGPAVEYGRQDGTGNGGADAD